MRQYSCLIKCHISEDVKVVEIQMNSITWYIVL